MKLTPWYPRGTLPAHRGVYHTDYGYQHWNGKFWGIAASTYVEAHYLRKEKSIFQESEWRGLAAQGGKT